MKCPYRKEIHKMGDWTVVNFGECYKEECPFYDKTEHKKRYNGGYDIVIRPVCRRACEESEDEK